MDFIEFDDYEIKTEKKEFTFDFIELDVERKILPGRSDLIKCESCGALNAPENNYCASCQMEIVKFRAMELDTKPIKVVLKFPKADKYITCPICGALNPKTNNYCQDCMVTLK